MTNHKSVTVLLLCCSCVCSMDRLSDWRHLNRITLKNKTKKKVSFFKHVKQLDWWYFKTLYPHCLARTWMNVQQWPEGLFGTDWQPHFHQSAAGQNKTRCSLPPPVWLNSGFNVNASGALKSTTWDRLQKPGYSVDNAGVHVATESLASHWKHIGNVALLSHCQIWTGSRCYDMLSWKVLQIQQIWKHFTLQVSTGHDDLMVMQQISCLLSRQSKQGDDLSLGENALTALPNVVKPLYSSVSAHNHPPPPQFAITLPLLLLFYPSFPLSADHGKLISICFTVIWHNSSIAAAVPARWARLPPVPAAHRLPAGSRHREPWLSTLLAGGFPTASSKKTLDCATTKVLYAPHPPLEPVVVFFFFSFVFTHSAAFEVHVRLWCHAALSAVTESFAKSRSEHGGFRAGLLRR